MQSHPETETVTGDFVWLRAGELRLVLPHHDVGAAEYRDARPMPAATRGLLRHEGAAGARHYAALSSDMTLLDKCPTDRFVIAPLRGVDLGWYWNEVRVLIGITLHLHSLPACLAGPSTPVYAWVEHGGELAYAGNAARVCEYALAAREDA